MDAYTATDRLMTESFGCPASDSGPPSCGPRAALRPGLSGGWYYHDDAQVAP